MSGSAVRVVDPVLTQVARGYRNPAYVGDALFPRVPVGARGGKIIEFGKESFRLYNTARAPGSKVAVAQFGYTGQAYALTDHALSGLVPIEHMEDASQTPGIDLGSGAVRFVQDIIALRLEFDQATVARTAGTYAASNKATLSGTSQWSHASSLPIAAIEAAKEVIRGKIGMRPNTLLLGASVFAALKQHSTVVDRIKYTGRDSATPELLASLLDLQRVVVGDAIYVDADGNTVDVWGNDAILAFTNIAPLASQGAPSYGYTYQMRNYPVVETAYYDNTHRSWLYPVADSVSPVIAGAEAGFLWTAAAA
jgi:hypothetical protein